MIALPLLFSRIDGEKATATATTDVSRPDVPLKAILSPTIISFTIFFMMLSLSMGGLQNFSVVALSSLYGLPLAIGNMGLTAYLSGIALGILAGGYIADLTRRHGDVAAGGFALTAVFTFVIATVNLGVFVVLVMGVVGFLVGLIMPSRDMLVRESAPPGASGRVFGIVTTGFNISGTIGQMIYGFIIQIGQPPADVLHLDRLHAIDDRIAAPTGAADSARTRPPGLVQGAGADHLRGRKRLRDQLVLRGGVDHRLKVGRPERDAAQTMMDVGDRGGIESGKLGDRLGADRFV